MKDYDDIREDITDLLMDGETIAGYRLHDILEGSLILGDELAFVFKGDKAQRLDDLQSKCRRIVVRFVNEHMDEEVRALMQPDMEEV